MHAVKITMAIFSAGLFCLFAVGATFNARCWIKGATNERHSYVAPLIAGIAGCLALVLCPFHQTARYSWIPLFLDVGCLPYLIGVSIYLLHDWWITNPRFTIQTFEHKATDVQLTVTLFRTGQVTMLKRNLTPRPASSVEVHWISISNGGTWKEDGGALILETYQGKITYHKVEVGRYVWQASDRPTAFDHVDLANV